MAASVVNIYIPEYGDWFKFSTSPYWLFKSQHLMELLRADKGNNFTAYAELFFENTSLYGLSCATAVS